MNPEAAAAHAATGVDSLASIVILIVAGISLLVLLGMGAMMAIGAVFSNRPLVTSWPVDQEQAFTVFENHGSSSNSRAWALGLVGGGIVLFAAIGVYFGIPPEKKDLTKDMNMSNLSKKTRPAAKAAPPAESPRPDPAPAAESPRP
jgi:hypothetical protein